MPELPEVESVRRGIAPLVTGRRVVGVTARREDLRWPLPVAEWERELVGTRFAAPGRRGKYLLLFAEKGVLILHLGMSGTLRVLPSATPPGTHDHLDFLLEGEEVLRLRDPRRFGAALWWREEPARHPLLAELGPEPLEEGFSPAYLYGATRGRRTPIKVRLMDSHCVVGVGNIYATEALFAARIHPATPAGALSRAGCTALVRAVRAILTAAIQQGGTTLRDFQRIDGAPGYFRQELRVYGRAGQPCTVCGTLIQVMRLGQRSCYICPLCQSIV